MLKWIAGTTLLILAWTAVWAWNFIYSGSPHVTSILCPANGTSPCPPYSPPADNGPLIVAVYFVGLIIIVFATQWLYRRRSAK